MPFVGLYSTVFYEPIYNLLVLLYGIIPGHDVGVAIIFLTAIVKAVLWPLSAKALKSQKALQEIMDKPMP